MTVQQTHAHQRFGISRFNLYGAGLTIPYHRSDIHIKELDTTIRQNAGLTTQQGKPKPWDKCRWHRQKTGKAGINDRLNLLLISLGTKRHKLNDCFAIGVDHPGDHGVSAPMGDQPKRWTPRW